jgi:hypothetical protein
LRLADTSYKPFGFDLPTVIKPVGIRLKGISIKEIPVKGVASQKYFLETEAVKGVFYLPLYKREYEGVVPAGTLVKKYGLTYFTKIKGVTIPLVKYEAVSTGRAGGVAWYKVIEEAGYYSKTSLVSPYGIGVVAVKPSGYKPSEYKAVGYYPSVKYYPTGKPSYKLPGYQKIVYKVPSYKTLSYPRGGYTVSTYAVPSYEVPSYKTTSYKTTTYVPPTEITPPPPPWIPKLKVGVFGFPGKKGKFRKPSFKPKYTPSIEAGFFNIRGKQPRMITGLEMRPLPLIKKRRKK